MKNLLKSKRFYLIIASVIIALIVFIIRGILSEHPYLVEKFYSRTTYRFLSQSLSFIFGLVQFSAIEILIAVTAVFSIIYMFTSIIKTIVNLRIKPFLNFITYIICLSCALYSCFYIFWGFNWYREPISDYFGYTVQETHVDELTELCYDLAGEINKIRPQINEDTNGVMQINDSDTDLLNRASKGFINLSEEYYIFDGIYSRPQYLLSSKFFCYMNTTGIFIPYTYEANINKYTPDCSKPATILHEMAHQRGFPNESEANFIAYLACLAHDDIDYKYSGYRLAFVYSMNALYQYSPDAYSEIYSTLCDGYKRDAAAHRDFWKQYENNPIEKISETVNNSYIKSNGDDNGIHSYGKVVDLLLAERRAKIK